jgi:hypothetical protein
LESCAKRGIILHTGRPRMPALIWLVIVIVAIVASRLVLKEVGKKALA